jgi:hypothetical protein
MTKRSLTNLLVLTVTLLQCTIGYGQIGATPHGHGNVTVILTGQDTNTKAEGNRNSNNHLFMVYDPMVRNATISVDQTLSSGLKNLKSGYPKWKGDGVQGNDGELFAKWKGSLVGSKVYCEYDPGKIAEFPITVIPNSSLEINIDSERFKGYIDAANKLINAISEVQDPFKFNGKLSGSFGNCDFYNDGDLLGHVLRLGGEVSIDMNLLDLKKVIPTTIPALSVRVGAKIDAFKITVAGNFVFDEGKQHPWIASNGSISGGCGVSILGEAILGVATDKGDAGVIVSITGSTSIKATGTITGEKRTIDAQGKGEAGKLKVTGSIEARFGPLGSWQVGSVDFVIFEGDSGETEKVEIYSF